MSFTESGRLSALQATVRACAVQTAILNMRCTPAQAPNRSVGNSESGRLSKLQSDLVSCREIRGTIDAPCPSVRPLASTRTIQTGGAYTASRVSNLALNAEKGISAGGTSESQRLRLVQSSLTNSNTDFITNPNNRFLQYQRFFPAPCPPAQNANNLPIPRPRFPCVPNQFPFS